MPVESNEAAVQVEARLRAAGWAIEPHASGENATQSRVEREFALGRLRLDYALFIADRLVGVVEVKTRLSQAAELQARGILKVLAQEPSELYDHAHPPVVYISTGRETMVVTSDSATPREIASFHRPEALAGASSLRTFAAEMGGLPSELPDHLPRLHADPIRRLEASLASGERRALLYIAQGGGRTNLIVAETARLLNHTSVHRVLVLVDRHDLAQQLGKAFVEYEGAGHRLDDECHTVVADTAGLQLGASVIVVTVQRLVSLLGEDAKSSLPVDSFGFIWALDPERLTDRRWENVLDYFDAPLVGVTQNPTPEAFTYFDGNLVARLDTSELLRDRPAPKPDEEQLANIWSRVSRLRGRMPLGEAFIEALQEGDLPLEWRELAAVSQRLAPPNMFVLAEFVLDFLADYFRDRQADLLVDPFAINPVLLSAIVGAGTAQQAVGFLPDASSHALAHTLVADPRVSWVPRNLLDDEERAAEIGHPSVIVSIAPLGGKMAAQSVQLADGRVLNVRDDGGHRLLLRTAIELAEEGEAVFLVADSFFRSGPGRVRDLLAEAGLHVHSVLAVRHGLKDAVASLSLIFIRRSQVEDVFVGELSPNIEREQLLSHLQRRRRGPAPALGRLVPWEGFKGFRGVVEEERVEALLADLPGEVCRLVEILAGRAVKPRKGEDFELLPNAVYLPTFSTSLVHASRDELTSKPWGYFQLPLDPGRASAEYVAWLLNSEAGKELRESIAAGSAHPTISRAALEQLRLPLPDLGVQQEVATLRARIGALRLELDGLERRLSGEPESMSAVAAALDELGARDPLTTFRELLPFPLASILWRYEADADIREKVGHLHGFFEAAATYLATILHSAFATDDELNRRERGKWFRAEAELL